MFATPAVYIVYYTKHFFFKTRHFGILNKVDDTKGIDGLKKLETPMFMTM